MKIKVLFNKKKKWARETARKVKVFLKKHRAKVVARGADLTITIGGDGTMLYYKEQLEGTVLGIGSERSYVCHCREANWKEILKKFLKKPRYEERIMLSVSIGKKKVGYAINDAALLSPDHSMLPVTITVEGDTAYAEGDGIIICTPTGSTAYGYSAGGAIMEGTLDAMEIVPLAPYKRLFEPIVLDGSRRIELCSEKPSHLVIDGQQTIDIPQDRKVYIEREKKKLHLAVC